MQENRKVDILGLHVNKISFDRAVNTMLSFLDSNKQHMVFTPNPEFVLLAEKDKEYRDIINQGDLVVPDGIGLIYGAKILGDPLIERVPGVDLLETVLSKLTKDQTVYFLGASPGIAKEAKEILETRYENLNIVGVRDGYFKEEETEAVIKDINTVAPDILLVGLGTPRQEKWIMEHKSQIEARVFMGVGGSFDAISGNVPRAPEKWQNLGLEWLYRLIKEPSRIKRQIFIPIYMLKVIWQRVKNICKK